ncbi:hypothetical protein AAHA92_17170 [Salvia divinorum]|uniref:Secreted protein n=1 Tax=Salvia divinorum TaxID=28513 RepID=A0ABD1GXX3_SALDI
MFVVFLVVVRFWPPRFAGVRTTPSASPNLRHRSPSSRMFRMAGVAIADRERTTVTGSGSDDAGSTSAVSGSSNSIVG